MEGFKASDRVADHYDGNPAFAAVLNCAVPGFEYPNWSYLTLAAALGRLPVEDRERAEDALNGWRVRNVGLTDGQMQLVGEHSGDQRAPCIREAVGKIGADALALVRAGDIQGARELMEKTGLSTKTIALLLAGWRHYLMGDEIDDKPTICCVVNALAHKVYVGRIVRIADDVIWQEVEPGQIIEHERSNLGEIPDALADPFYRQKAMSDGELRNAWMNSWSIAYADGGKGVIKTAALCLLDGNSVKPNPFRGRIVSETERRFVQEHEGTVYSGHLKSMTGALTVGESYQLTYKGPIGQQVIHVEAMTVETDTVIHEAKPIDRAVMREWKTPISDQDVLSIGVEIFRRLNVVVIPRDIADCLEQRRGNASYSGRILDIDEEQGLVVQSLGRQQATVHRLADFEYLPNEGKSIEIKYRDGRLGVVKEPGQERGASR